MPRVKASPKKCVKTNIQSPPNHWLMMLKGDALEQYTGTGTPDIVTLRHPNTEEPAVFLFSPANNSVQEILTFNEGKRSWFIDESVTSDGKLHLSTPIDPIFLVLPYLRKHCTSHAMPLDQILHDDEFPETERLLKSSGLKYLNLISDKKGEETIAYKYNEEKTLAWLKKKTERVAEILKQKNINVSGGAMSATYIKTTKEPQDNDAYLRYAAGIVSEYLMSDLNAKLFQYLNLPDEPPPAVNLKRKSVASDGNQEKKTKMDVTSPPTPAVDLTKSDKSSKEKARAKAAAGTKSITSFFKKV